MAKRKHEILTDAEREQLIGIPTDRDRLARLYTIEPADIDLIGARREQISQQDHRESNFVTFLDASNGKCNNHQKAISGHEACSRRITHADTILLHSRLFIQTPFGSSGQQLPKTERRN